MTTRPPTRIPCGKKLLNRDFEPAGKCGETYYRPGMPSHCEFCSDCTRELAGLGVKVLNFRMAIQLRNEMRFPVFESTETLLREYGVLEI
jgi:hypothetical protein